MAQRHNLTLMFDAAHAFGCSYKGRMLGNFGRAEVFSFHATKFLNCFEGGMIATNNDELAAKIRLMKNFGFNGYDSVIYVGTNGKMSEACAAMGLTNLESVNDFIAANRANYQTYKECLRDIPGVKLVEYTGDERLNYQYIVTEIDRVVTGIDRDQLLDILWKENVRARRYFYPGCHRMEPYRSYFPHAHLLLQKTEALADRILVLPTGMTIDPDKIETICRLIAISIHNSRQIVDRLRRQANA
jgi:dTDP-4-amino-4,6-dideoxygalactose transaminase